MKKAMAPRRRVMFMVWGKYSEGSGCGMICAEIGGVMRLSGSGMKWAVVCVIFAAVHGVSAQQSGSETYSGVMPCADCSGIRTVLTLKRDAQGTPSSYTMSEIYLGRPAAGTLRTSGTWAIIRGDAADKNATVYQVHPSGTSGGSSYLLVDANTLRLLDGSLGELPASIPHTLKRGSGATVVTEQTGGDTSLKIGGVLEVRLESNHTTGYSWVQTPAANPILTRLGAAAYEEKPAGGKTGVGGMEIWKFKAVQAGKQSLRFEYRRPWEKDVAAAKTVTFNVTVQ
jgi:copper homeostasis protein (lipoprotein)